MLPNTRLKKLVKDRSGVALPLALLALVVVSLLVTAALLTSSTELAISHAHRDATKNLYVSESALQGYIAQQAGLVSNTNTTTLRPISTVYTLPTGEDAYITVSRLLWQNAPPVAPSNQGTVTETFSVVADSTLQTDLTVGALITTLRTYTTIQANIDAGATFGGGVNVSGNSKISASSDLCAGQSSENAVMFTSDVAGSEKKISMDNVEGDTASYTGVTSDSLIKHTLGGATINDLVLVADIRFGFADDLVTYDSGRKFNESRKPSSITYADTSKYNWGCPQELGITCDSEADKLHEPIVVINANGATIGLQGEHGQGILAIINGNLKITGNFIYKGILLVDGHIEVAGTGTDATKIEGALLSTGGIKDSRVSGNAFVNYNQCAIDQVAANFNNNAWDNYPQTFSSGTFSWFEVVR